MTLEIIKVLNIVSIEKSQNMLNALTDKAIIKIYIESVEFKHKYNLAYTRLLNELNKRNEKQKTN